MKRFATFDIDGTLIRWQLYHGIVNELAKSGHLTPKAYDTIRKSRRQWKARAHDNSYKDYENALVQTYHAAITELDINTYLQAVEAVFHEHKDQVYTFTRDLLTTLKEKDYLLFAISGSQHEVITKLAEYYGFDDAVGNTYERKDDRFTGNHQNIIANKAEVLEGLVKKHKATYEGSIGVGDSESDVPMLAATEQAIAFNPTKGLLDHAREKKWKIVVERKNTIYELEPGQGTRYELTTE